MDRQRILLELAEQQGCIAKEDVEAALKVSQAIAILILRDMVEEGLFLERGFRQATAVLHSGVIVDFR